MRKGYEKMNSNKISKSHLDWSSSHNYKLLSPLHKKPLEIEICYHWSDRMNNSRYVGVDNNI